MILLKYVESKCGSVDDIVQELQVVTKEQVDQYTQFKAVLEQLSTAAEQL